MRTIAEQVAFVHAMDEECARLFALGQETYAKQMACESAADKFGFACAELKKMIEADKGE